MRKFSTTLTERFRDPAIWILSITALTIAVGVLLAEAQVALGWEVILLGLMAVLGVFAVANGILVRPLRSDLRDALADLQEQINIDRIPWLLDTQALANYEERQEAKEIWLLSSDLLDDTSGGPFEQVVRKNLARGVSYIFYVPNTPEIRSRIELIFAAHGNHPNLAVRYLPDTFFFLVPKLDIVIYNPRQTPRSAYMGIPALAQDEDHYHAAINAEFIDRLVGTLLQQVLSAETKMLPVAASQQSQSHTRAKTPRDR